MQVKPPAANWPMPVTRWKPRKSTPMS
jgi:hypothetical protein